MTEQQLKQKIKAGEAKKIAWQYLSGLYHNFGSDFALEDYLKFQGYEATEDNIERLRDTLERMLDKIL